MRIAFYALTDEDLFLDRLPVARHLEEAGYQIVFGGPANVYSRHIQSEGFEFSRVVDMGRSVPGDVAATLSLFRTLKQISPDIVHTFGLRAALRGGLAARMGQLPWVVHSVLPPRSGLKHRPPALLKAALSDAEVTFRRQEDRDAFIAGHFVRPEQTHVLRSSGIDLRDFPMSDEPHRTPVVVLFRPAPDDLSAFGEAARSLAGEGIDARFAIIGPSETPAMRKQLQRWQEEGAVEWWGHRDDVPGAFSTVHVICLPRQTTAADLIVAGASGRALIGAEDPSDERILRRNENAVLLDPNNASELTLALRDLLTDAEKRQRMGRRAREIIEAEYSAQRVAQEIMGVYERLFEKGRKM